MRGTSWSQPQKVGILYLAVSAGGGTTRWLLEEDSFSRRPCGKLVTRGGALTKYFEKRRLAMTAD